MTKKPPTKPAANFAGLNFDNHYARLPETFYAKVKPTPVAKPGLIKINHALATELGLDAAALESEAGLAVLAGNTIAPGSEPIAQAYAGHQFGYFNPQLGDGRAILLGEVRDIDGRLRDIQLKGSGPTPFSRRGDGRAAIGPVIREYIVSEAMHALRVKTTRSLAAVTTGEIVYRDTPLPGAVLTRVAASHVRIGTFEFFRGRNDKESVKQLADFVIERHHPAARDGDNPYLALLDCVIDAQASLVARWMQIGFIHGVMNTDNMTVSGETIDYGPCAFMDRYDPATVYSFIDREGRYAFGNQASITLWNLSRFAECLLHLFDENSASAVSKAEERLGRFPDLFKDYWLTGMHCKLGLSLEIAEDESLIESLLNLMQEQKVDFTQAFRALTQIVSDEEEASGDDAQFLALFPDDPAAVEGWLRRWRARLAREELPAEEIVQTMRVHNPVYIPRNHLVEAAIQAAQIGDYAPMHGLVDVLSRPYEEQPGKERFAQPPAPGEEVMQTFCGT